MTDQPTPPGPQPSPVPPGDEPGREPIVNQPPPQNARDEAVELHGEAPPEEVVKAVTPPMTESPDGIQRTLVSVEIDRRHTSGDGVERGSWRVVVHEIDDKTEAVALARELYKRFPQAELIIKSENGRIQAKDTWQGDPRDTRG